MRILRQEHSSLGKSDGRQYVSLLTGLLSTNPLLNPEMEEFSSAEVQKSREKMEKSDELPSFPVTLSKMPVDDGIPVLNVTLKSSQLLPRSIFDIFQSQWPGQDGRLLQTVQGIAMAAMRRPEICLLDLKNLRKDITAREFALQILLQRLQPVRVMLDSVDRIDSTWLDTSDVVVEEYSKMIDETIRQCLRHSQLTLGVNNECVRNCANPLNLEALRQTYDSLSAMIKGEYNYESAKKQGHVVTENQGHVVRGHENTYRLSADQKRKLRTIAQVKVTQLYKLLSSKVPEVWISQSDQEIAIFIMSHVFDVNPEFFFRTAGSLLNASFLIQMENGKLCRAGNIKNDTSPLLVLRQTGNKQFHVLVQPQNTKKLAQTTFTVQDLAQIITRDISTIPTLPLPTGKTMFQHDNFAPQ